MSLLDDDTASLLKKFLLFENNLIFFRHCVLDVILAVEESKIVWSRFFQFVTMGRYKITSATAR